MIKIEDLRIGQDVRYNGIVCKVYSINGPKPDKSERFDNMPTVELFDGAGLITALEEDIFPFYGVKEDHELERIIDAYENDTIDSIDEALIKFGKYKDERFKELLKTIYELSFPRPDSPTCAFWADWYNKRDKTVEQWWMYFIEHIK